MSERAYEVASTILRQLGGRHKLEAMIRARNFTYDQNGTVSFYFDSCKRANIIEIEYTPDDLYNLRFKKFRPINSDVQPVKTYQKIYVDDLRPLIENFTGLYLSLNA